MGMTAPTCPSACAAAVATATYPGGEDAGRSLDALARRNFPELESCLDTNVRFRALVPRGTLEANGAAQAIALFRRWFGEDDTFDVIDAAIGQVGPRLYLRWQARTGSTGAPSPFRLAQPHPCATPPSPLGSLQT